MLRRWCDSGAGAFVFLRVHLQGLEGGAMAFVWVPWRMKDHEKIAASSQLLKLRTNCEDLSSI